ncbi:MAG: murein biosynthesis integral membrane protein MurJ [Patescibacteria group bacterium]
MRFHYITSRQKFFKGSAILAVTTVASYALGLLRDRQFAHLFGASHQLDAYQAAFIIPDLLLNIFVAGGLAAAFIPLLAEIRTHNNDREVSDYINSILNGSILVVCAVGLVTFFLAPWIAPLIVRGFPPDVMHQYIVLLRIMLISPIIFAVSNALGNLLASQERFFWYGISAIVYNLGIILGTWLLFPSLGIYAAGVGVLMGSLLHLIPRVFGAWRMFSYRPRIMVDQYIRKFIRLMLPKMIGHPVEQITFLGFTAIASSIGGGAITVLNFARNFQSAPVAVVGITLSMTLFPIISRSAAANNRVEFMKELLFTVKLTLLILIPSAILMYVIREPLIRILLGGGAFDETAVKATAAALGIFTLAIPTESLSHLFARAFYALKNSIIPVFVSIGGLFLSIAVGYVLSRSMGVRGLALGFFIGSVVKVALLAILLRRAPFGSA